MVCEDEMLTLETIRIDEGYYRHSATAEVLECKPLSDNTIACLGGTRVGPTDSW